MKKIKVLFAEDDKNKRPRFCLPGFKAGSLENFAEGG